MNQQHSICLLLLNPLSTVGLCHYYILGESVFNLRGVRVYNMLIKNFFFGKWLINLQNSGEPAQMPHYMASDLGLHFLPILL